MRTNRTPLSQLILAALVLAIGPVAAQETDAVAAQPSPSPPNSSAEGSADGGSGEATQGEEEILVLTILGDPEVCNASALGVRFWSSFVRGIWPDLLEPTEPDFGSGMLSVASCRVTDIIAKYGEPDLKSRETIQPAGELEVYWFGRVGLAGPMAEQAGGSVSYLVWHSKKDPQK